jgi:hypothetical protein
MNHLLESRFLEAVGLIALLAVVLVIVVVRARRRRREESRSIRMHFRESDRD